MSAPGPMTEAAFRLAFLADAGPGYAPEGRAVNAAVAAAKAAGLVFAPEPVRLPERLGLDGIHLTWPGEGGNIIARATLRLLNTEGYDLAVAVLAEAVRRYNAYPTLRQRAEALVTTLRPRSEELGWIPWRPDMLALEAVLAGEPK